MPENVAFFILLTVALAVGFLLGRRARRRQSDNPGLASGDYFKELNQLLNERHDVAIDSFVENIAAASSTVDAHLALGSLVRRRGEVDRAIRIHQNLLARLELSGTQREQTELELARDYLVAGLLDRAESLLLELAARNGEHSRVARELLLEIYQQEKEWVKAVNVGETLARVDSSVRGRMAHFECELALAHIQQGDLRAARSALAAATKLDAQCARSALVGAELEMTAGRYKAVCKELRRVRELNPDLAAQTLPLFRAACEAMDRPEQYFEYLLESAQQTPNLPVFEELAEQLVCREGMQAALDFRLQKLTAHPSLAGFIKLLEALQAADEPLQVAQMTPLLEICRTELERQVLYRCRTCGFGARSLMWQCPSCRNWGAMKPISAQELVQG